MSSPGFFDLPSPLFSMLDRVLVEHFAMAAVGRIAVFAAIAAIVSMFVYRFFSNQALLEQLKSQIRNVQGELSQTSLQAGELRAAIVRNMRLTARQLFLSFWPALLASIPIVFILVFCSNQYSYVSPAAGDRLYVTPSGMDGSPASYLWAGSNVQWDARKQAWTLYYEPGAQSILLNDSGLTELALPTKVATAVIHKKRWWNSLLANPAGYLPDNNRIDQFEFNTATQRIIDWGPGWMRGWMFAFIVFLIVFSLMIKRIWKIH